jgi:hypothetical protein
VTCSQTTCRGPAKSLWITAKASAIFVGKARRYNGRFLQMCSHHLIEPVACTPASGWEKGQVENQVGNLRDQIFRPEISGPAISSLALLLHEFATNSVKYGARFPRAPAKSKSTALNRLEPSSSHGQRAEDL